MQRCLYFMSKRYRPFSTSERHRPLLPLAILAFGRALYQMRTRNPQQGERSSILGSISIERHARDAGSSIEADQVWCLAGR